MSVDSSRLSAQPSLCSAGSDHGTDQVSEVLSRSLIIGDSDGEDRSAAALQYRSIRPVLRHRHLLCPAGSDGGTRRSERGSVATPSLLVALTVGPPAAAFQQRSIRPAFRHSHPLCSGDSDDGTDQIDCLQVRRKGGVLQSKSASLGSLHVCSGPPPAMRECESW